MGVGVVWEAVHRTFPIADAILPHVLAALRFTPSVLATLYAEDSTQLWVSSAVERAFPARSLIGVRLDELGSLPGYAAERMALIRDVAASDQPTHTVEIFRGVRLEGILLPVCGDEGPRVLMLARFAGPLTPIDAAGAPATVTRHLIHADWGPLAGLTPRQLDVLRLIAAGLDNAAIAERLHRTKRAVEWHIRVMNRRLRTSQRVDLFRFGFCAGLPMISDPHWARILAAMDSGGREAGRD